MSITKAQARSKLRNLLRDTNTDDFTQTYVDERMSPVYYDLLEDIAAGNPDAYLTRKVLTGITDSSNPGTAGSAPTVNELYPFPDDMGKLRFIYRDDLAGKPILWGPRPEQVGAFRFPGTLQGTLQIGDATWPVPRFSAGQVASPEGRYFRVVPAPTSATQKLGIAYVRRLVVPAGENEVLDIDVELEEVLLQQTAYTILKIEGDPHAENIYELLHGNPRNTQDIGTYGRAKKRAREKLEGDMRLGRARFNSFM